MNDMVRHHKSPIAPRFGAFLIVIQEFLLIIAETKVKGCVIIGQLNEATRNPNYRMYHKIMVLTYHSKIRVGR